MVDRIVTVWAMAAVAIACALIGSGIVDARQATPVASPIVPDTASPAAVALTVEIRGFAYQPRTSEIAAGETVRWRNFDASAHTVTSDTRDFDSERMDRGAGFRVTFEETGVFSYACAYHKDMSGVIIVR